MEHGGGATSGSEGTGRKDGRTDGSEGRMTRTGGRGPGGEENRVRGTGPARPFRRGPNGSGRPDGRGMDVCGGSDRGRHTAAGSRSSVLSVTGRFIVTDMIAAPMLRAPATYHAGA